MTSKVKDSDRGAKLLTRRLRELDREGSIKLTVGVHDDVGRQQHPSGQPIGKIANVIESGARGKSPVSFLRSSFDERRATLGEELAAAGRRVLFEGVTLEQAYTPPLAAFVRTIKSRVPVRTGTTRGAIEARIDGERVA
jgi:hypothetical protein